VSASRQPHMRRATAKPTPVPRRHASLLPSKWLMLLAGCFALGSMVLIAWPGAFSILLSLNLLLLLLALLDWFITPGPRSLILERQVHERLSLLHPSEVKVLVRNDSRSSLRFRWRDTIPLPFQVTDREQPEGEAEVGPQSQHISTYTVNPRKRGLYAFEDLHVRYRSLLHLWERAVVLVKPQDVKVYPSVAEVERYHLLARANRLDLVGLRHLRIKGTAEFESLRDYMRGDDVRLLDWKATARRQKLIVRNQQAERNQTIIVMLDSGRLMNAEENGISKLDQAINATLLLSHVALSRGDRIGLCAFSHRSHIWVTPRSSMHQMQLISDSLYNLQGDYTESNHAKALATVSARFNKRALLIVLTDFVDAATSNEMFAHLRQSSRKHLVLFTALKDRYLHTASRQHAESRTTGYESAMALGLLEDRQVVLEKMRHFGAQVIDANVEELAPRLLNKYLEIMNRGLL
jgi:uncharacterized protein (DUF58 family)